MRSATLKMATLNSAALARAALLARMEPAQSMVNTPHLLAAVDLGSNSFRLIVGRVEETEAGSQIYQSMPCANPCVLPPAFQKTRCSTAPRRCAAGTR